MDSIKVEPSILVYAFRYALGRMTYAVWETANAIIINKHLLPKKDRMLIVAEITEAINNDRAGMDCDVEEWERCRKCLMDYEASRANELKVKNR